MRESVLSPQFGTQTLPKPHASPEHGRLPTSTAVTTVLVFTSRRWTVFFGPLVTQTESSVSTCQSGVPSAEKTAIGVTADIWRWTPGSLTPGRGGRGARCCAHRGEVTTRSTKSTKILVFVAADTSGGVSAANEAGPGLVQPAGFASL